MTDKLPLIFSGDAETSTELMEYLLELFPQSMHKDRSGWQTEIRNGYPVLGEYLVSALENNLSADPVTVQFDGFESADVRMPLDILLSSIGTGIGLVCGAGGSALLAELLKTWIEGKRGRSIKIRRGDVELEIQGVVRKRELEELVAFFDEHFGKEKGKRRRK
jgi:hypothetical protein